MPVTNNDYLGHDQSRAKLMHVWSANVIKRWIQEIEAQEISRPDKLISSLRKRVYNAAGGDQTKIVFTLLNYGRFVDLGVGRGEKYNRRKHDPVFWSGQKYPETPGFKYQVKPWMLPVFKQRVYSLAAILERKYNEYAQLMIIQNIAPEKFFNNNTNPL